MARVSHSGWVYDCFSCYLLVHCSRASRAGQRRRDRLINQVMAVRASINRRRGERERRGRVAEGRKRLRALWGETQLEAMGEKGGIANGQARVCW